MGNNANTATKAANNTQAPANNTQAPANNTQAPAAPVPHLGKYAALTAKLGTPATMPSNFKYAGTVLACNIAPKGAASVMGVIYNMVRANPGITGGQLLGLMLAHTWVGHPSAYTKPGVVCAAWAVGYINGALRTKHQHLKVVTK